MQRRTCHIWAAALLAFTPSLRAQDAPAFRMLDLRPYVNMGWKDDVAGDGKGGWTDEGGADMQAVKPGTRSYWGVPYELVDPVANDGKAVLTFSAERFTEGIERCEIPVGSKAGSLHFVQTAAYCEGHMADWIVHYADGKKETIPIRAGEAINDLYGPRDGAQCRVAFTVPRGGARVGMHLFSWINPRPDQPIDRVEMVSKRRKQATVVVAAVTVADRPVVFPDEAIYGRRDTFAETLLASRAAYLAWRDALPEAERGILKAEGHLDPAGRVLAAVARDFPDATSRENWQPPFLAWIRERHSPRLFVEAVTDMLKKQEEAKAIEPASAERLRASIGKLTQEAGDEPERRRLYGFLNALSFADAASFSPPLGYMRQVASELPAGPDAEALSGRIGATIGVLEQARTRMLANLEQGVADAVQLPAAFRDDVRRLQADAGLARLRAHGADRIVFAVRTEVAFYHWYESFGYFCDAPDLWDRQVGGRLVLLDTRTGETKDLVNDPRGSVRDPSLSYDGQTILFSYRPAEQMHFCLYTIGVDGTGLRQITRQKETDDPRDQYDDIEPIYLPEGDIVFTSSRARRWVPCLNAQVATLYRCKPDGADIRPLTANVETENTPWVMPDGRLLYMRWEYVERDRAWPHGLWTINPDGTGQMTFWGNMNEGDVFIDAKPIPGTDEVIFTAHPHGSGDHRGTIKVLTPNDGPDEHRSIRKITPDRRLARDGYFDPYPVAKGVYLFSQQHRLLLYDDDGNFLPIHELPSARHEGDVERGTTTRLCIQEPRVATARPREPVIPSRIDLGKETGTLILSDITQGRNTAGIAPGVVKKLLVLEILPKPVDHDGHTENLSWNGNFFLERVLGTVPVEADGSAHFKVPAMRNVAFVAMDANDHSVKRMQSFVSLCPGETTGCVGCHENRTQVDRRHTPLAALGKPPATIAALPGIPGIHHFPRDVQPVLDRHCIACHGTEPRAGNVVLSGDLDPWFNQGYVTLRTRELLASGWGGVGGKGNAAPYTLGTGASKLMRLIDPTLAPEGRTHQGVKLEPGELDTMRYWIESWAQYSGTFAALNNDGNERILVSRELTRKRCASCHTDDFRRGGHHGPSEADLREGLGLRINCTRPEMSLMLRAPLAKEAGGLGLCRQRQALTYAQALKARGEGRDIRAMQLGGNEPEAKVFASTADQDYQAMLADIKAQVAANLKGRMELPGFVPNPNYVREMKKYGLIPRDFVADGTRDLSYFFGVDEAYYRMFWYVPEGK